MCFVRFTRGKLPPQYFGVFDLISAKLQLFRCVAPTPFIELKIKGIVKVRSTVTVYFLVNDGDGATHLRKKIGLWFSINGIGATHLNS